MSEEWIDVNDELPGNKMSVLIAILHRYGNAPAKYSITEAFYKNNEWFDPGSGGQSFTRPTHWQYMPSPPAITYEIKPEDCSHEWAENAHNRYCPRCNSEQTRETITNWR